MQLKAQEGFKALATDYLQLPICSRSQTRVLSIRAIARPAHRAAASSFGPCCTVGEGNILRIHCGSMPVLHAQGSVMSDSIFHGHNFRVLSRRLPIAVKPARNSKYSASPFVNNFQSGKSRHKCACGRSHKLKKAPGQAQCRASAAAVADEVETVEVSSSDMLHFTQPSDNSGVEALASNTLEIQRLSDDLQRQIASLTAFTVCTSPKFGMHTSFVTNITWRRCCAARGQRENRWGGSGTPAGN